MEENGKLIQVIDMLREDIRQVHDENVRQSGKIDTLLVDTSTTKTKVNLLPCTERKEAFDKLSTQVEENTHYRLKVATGIGIVVALIGWVVPTLAKML